MTTQWNLPCKQPVVSNSLVEACIQLNNSLFVGKASEVEGRSCQRGHSYVIRIYCSTKDPVAVVMGM